MTKRDSINSLLLILLVSYVVRSDQKTKNAELLQPMVLGVSTESATTAQTATPNPSRQPLQDSGMNETEVLQTIEIWGEKMGVDAELMKRVARCESGLDTNAKNGTYGGLFQFSESTWHSTRQAMGESVDLTLRFDVQAASKTAAWKIARDGFGAWKNCAR